MFDLEWNTVSIYPSGYFARDISVQAEVKLPAGWQIGSSLSVASQTNGVVKFQTVPYDVLVDSPLYAGANFKRFDLDPGAKVGACLDIFADTPELLDIKAEQIAPVGTLVKQANRLFGSHHCDHYAIHILNRSDLLRQVLMQLSDGASKSCH